MLLRRCAWHRRFRGYSFVHGVASWRGPSLNFTDGVCRGCAARVRREWQLVKPHERHRGASVALRRAASVLVGVSMLGAALLNARSLGDIPATHVAVAAPWRSPVPPAMAISPDPAADGSVTKVVSPPAAPRPAPRLVVLHRKSFDVLAKLELAQAQGDPHAPFGSALTRPPTAAGPVRQIGRIEDDLTREVVSRASAQLLIAMQDLPRPHAGTAVQTP